MTGRNISWKIWGIVLAFLLLSLLPARLVRGQAPEQRSSLANSDGIEALSGVVQLYSQDNDLLAAMESLDTWERRELVVAFEVLQSESTDASLVAAAALLQEELLLPEPALQPVDLLSASLIRIPFYAALALIACGALLLLLPHGALSRARHHASAIKERMAHQEEEPPIIAGSTLDDLVGTIAEIQQSVDNDSAFDDETTDETAPANDDPDETSEQDGAVDELEASDEQARPVTTVKLGDDAPEVSRVNRDGSSDDDEPEQDAAPPADDAKAAKQSDDADDTAQSAAGTRKKSGTAKTASSPQSSGSDLVADVQETDAEEASAQANDVASLLEDVFGEDEQGTDDLRVLSEGLEEVEVTELCIKLKELVQQLNQLDGR